MPDPNEGFPPRYLRTEETARLLGLSGRSLEKHRTYGTGPTYRKLGGRVVYSLDDPIRVDSSMAASIWAMRRGGRRPRAVSRRADWHAGHRP